MNSKFYGVRKIGEKYQVIFSGTMTKAEAKAERQRLNQSPPEAKVEARAEMLDETLDRVDTLYSLGDLPEPGSQAAHEMSKANREYLDRKRAEDTACAAEAMAWADFHDLILND